MTWRTNKALIGPGAVEALLCRTILFFCIVKDQELLPQGSNATKSPGIFVMLWCVNLGVDIWFKGSNVLRGVLNSCFINHKNEIIIYLPYLHCSNFYLPMFGCLKCRRV